MCSDLRSSAHGARPFLRLALLAVALLVPLAAVGCGKRGDPMPPPKIVPAPTKDLTLAQRGFEVRLELPYPKTTAAGLALPGLAAVEVYELHRPLLSDHTSPKVDAREFGVAAQKTMRLAGAELASATTGDRIIVRFLLGEPLPTPPEARFYAVKTFAPAGEASAFSNLVFFVPAAPPSPPTPLVVTAKPEGVELAWTAVEGTVAGYNLYRRNAAHTGYGEPLASLESTVNRHLDATATYGERYIYTVCTLASRQPLVESAPAGEREIDFQDRFPPPAPGGLRALPAVGEVRLLWEKSAAPDVVGYKLYRQDPEAEYRLVMPEPIVELSFHDSGLTSGLAFRYKVTAVDARGNEGPPSSEVEARIQ